MCVHGEAHHRFSAQELEGAVVLPIIDGPSSSVPVPRSSLFSLLLHLQPAAAAHAMDIERLKALAGGNSARTGGKGSVRRKKKTVHKTTSTDDKRLQNTLKRLGVNTIPGIEEVLIYKEDEFIVFNNPKGAYKSWNSMQYRWHATGS